MKGSGLGKGGLALGAAKMWFLIASYAISLSLTRLLEPDVYGQYYVVARLIAVPNMVIIYTLLFSVSRPLAAEYEQGFPSYRSLRRRGVRLAATLGGLTSVVFFAAAGWLAELLGDPALALPIRVVAPISLVYALYAVNLGTLNAVRRFPLQATLDVFMATAKASFIIAAAAVGLGLAATVGGFTAASVCALGLSAWLVARARPAGAGSQSKEVSMASFAGVLIVFTAVVNLLQSADVLILKRFADTAAQADAVGFYASAQQIALVPYSLMNAVALLAFPLIATLDAEGDAQRVHRYITQTAKVCILLLAFMSAVGSASASEIQSLLFPQAYGAAAGELRLLVWGFSGYSFAVTTAWIFNSTKRSVWALGLVVVPLLLVVVGTLTLVPTSFTQGAAWSVAIAGGVAALAAVVALGRAFATRLPVVHLAKVALAVASVELVSAAWPVMSTAGVVGKLLILAKLTGLSVVFIAVVALTRAVTMDQLRDLRHAR